MRPLLLAVALAASAAAQPGWQPLPEPGPALTLDLLYALGDDREVVSTDFPDPFAPEPFEVGITAAALVVGGRVPVGGGVSLVGELPLGYYAADFPDGLEFGGFQPRDASSLDAGNPYLGAELRVRPSLAVSGGVRLPVVEFDPRRRTSSGSQGGLVAETERFEAYVPDLLTVSAGVAAAPEVAPGVRLTARLDPALLVPTESDEGRGARGADVAVGAALGVEAAAGPATLSLGLFGRRLLTDGYFGEFDVFDTDGLLTAGAALEVGGVRPALTVRVPLDDSVLGQDATVGLHLDVPLR